MLRGLCAAPPCQTVAKGAVRRSDDVSGRSGVIADGRVAISGMHYSTLADVRMLAPWLAVYHILCAWTHCMSTGRCSRSLPIAVLSSRISVPLQSEFYETRFKSQTNPSPLATCMFWCRNLKSDAAWPQLRFPPTAREACFNNTVSHIEILVGMTQPKPGLGRLFRGS